jgi:hypothetical protein
LDVSGAEYAWESEKGLTSPAVPDWLRVLLEAPNAPNADRLCGRRARRLGPAPTATDM